MSSLRWALFKRDSFKLSLGCKMYYSKKKCTYCQINTTSFGFCNSFTKLSTFSNRFFSSVVMSFKLAAPRLMHLSDISYLSAPTVSVTLNRDSISESLRCASKLLTNDSISPLTNTLWSNTRYWAL